MHRVQHEADKASPEAHDPTAKCKAAGDGVEDVSPEFWLLKTIFRHEKEKAKALMLPSALARPAISQLYFHRAFSAWKQGIFSLRLLLWHSISGYHHLHFTSGDSLHLPTLLTQSHAALAHCEPWEEVSLGYKPLWPALFPLHHYPTVTSPLQQH